MGWRENRRRRRVWYRHYRQIADELVSMFTESNTISAEGIVNMFYQLYERRRLHGKRFVARSAFESMVLACRDAGLEDMALRQRTRPAGGGALPGDIIPRGGNADPNELERTPADVNEPVRARRELPPLPASALAQLGGFYGDDLVEQSQDLDGPPEAQAPQQDVPVVVRATEDQEAPSTELNSVVILDARGNPITSR